MTYCHHIREDTYQFHSKSCLFSSYTRYRRISLQKPLETGISENLNVIY